MIKSQDIHLNDKRLYETFQMLWNQGSYGQALALLKTNPQLESKAMEAKIINTLQDYLYELQQKSDPSFKSEKIIVSKEPPVPEIAVGKVYFKSLEYGEIIDEAIAYIKTVPEYTYKTKINSIGGKSTKWNSKVPNNTFVDVSGWIGSNGSVTLVDSAMNFNMTVGSSTGNRRAYHSISIPKERYVYISVDIFVENFGGNIRLDVSNLSGSMTDAHSIGSSTSYPINEWFTHRFIKKPISSEIKYFKVGTATATTGYTNPTIKIKNLKIIDLTAIYGAEKAEKLTIDSDEVALLELISNSRPQYEDGTTLYFNPINIASKTETDEVIQTIDYSNLINAYFPNGMQSNIDGDIYDELDFNNRKAIKRINDNGETLVIPIVNDITESIDSYIRTESNGTIIIGNSENIEIPVPNSITFYTLG